MDRQGKVVTRFKDRIEYLTAELNASSDIIGIPTPAMTEVLVRAGNNRTQYMAILGDSWKFQILPFDSRAAIEAAELVAAIKSKKEKWDTWAKVKFDIQIVAMAKAEGADVIFSDDQDIENYAKRFNIRVVRICDLPLPPSAGELPLDIGPVGAQRLLALVPPPEPTEDETLQPPAEGRRDASIAGSVPFDATADDERAKAEQNDELKAESAGVSKPADSDSGSAQDEAATKASGERK
jgi:hypothetical protein